MKPSPNIFFNAHHSPVGAFASFTLGCKGAKGGLGLELGRPADETLYVGVESRDGMSFESLPFYAQAEDGRARFDVDAVGGGKKAFPIHSFSDRDIRRDFRLGTDTWTAGDLAFRILSPMPAIPEPGKTAASAVKAAVVPAVWAELTVDNRRCKRGRVAFLAWQGSDPYSNMRWMNAESGHGFSGIGQGTRTAIVSRDRGLTVGTFFTVEDLLRLEHPDNVRFGLGPLGGIRATVPAGKRKTFTFAICFFHGGIVTAGLPTSYYYTRFFRDIEAVADWALTHAGEARRAALAANTLLDKAGHLSGDQRFQLAHAIRSYYGSTEFLQHEGRPLWVVNEGEYRMMNTFDLTVDHLFFELKQNPWVVRNALDLFLDRYAYRDRVRAPGSAQSYPGGLSFTHDMGIGNVFMRPAYSSYELFGLHGCFSHMTHEQLCNWVLCATTYAARSGDRAWMKRRLPALRACLESMINRDHHDPVRRDGLMSLDSDRCQGGSEITTYDSLDVSLGQSRHNLYMAVKCWASYVAMEAVFRRARDAKSAAGCAEQARKCADSIVAHQTPEGWIPAVMGEGNASRIIPAVEGLVFPWAQGLHEALDGNGRFGALMTALRRHLDAVLQPGVCVFPDGGWKISSTSDNSWLSKVYICQFVARRICGRKWGAAERRADAAHVAWLLDPRNAYWCWSDQMVAGVAKGSKYYPRGVTAALWLEE